MITYAEFRLRIDRGVARGAYRIVATGPAGEALGRFKLPFSEIELENFILKIGTTRRGRRRIESPEMELAKNFGAKLFGALFDGDVRELYRSSFAETRIAGKGLRLTLSLTGAPELLQVPWEYLYDHPSFLAISTWTPIVRYLDLPKPRRPLHIELPLRILALVSSPVDAEPIDARQEQTKLEGALAPLTGVGAIAVDWLEEPSLRSLQHRLRKADYHVFHYIGHSGYDEAADDGTLLFEDEHRHGRRVSGVELGTILADEVSLRLAVLNSCEGARSSVQDPFSGVATSLIEREIPAVIGMQFEITDRAAIVFASEFYAALADGLPVDSSVAEARKAIYADQNDIEWGTPVLFMRVADGRLFDVEAHTPIRPSESEPQAEPDEPRAVAAVDAEPIEAAGADQDRLERKAEETVKDAAPGSAPPAAPGPGREGQNLVPLGAADVDTPIAAVASAREPDMTIAATAKVAARASSDVSPRLPRSAGRAALGGVLTVAIADAFDLVRDSSSDNLNAVVGAFVGVATLMVIGMVVAVILAERLWPAFRIPGGSAYDVVGGNRWAATVIQGALTGGTVGFAVTVFHKEWLLSPDVALQYALITASGFVIAEAALDWLFGRRPDELTPA